MSFQTNGADKNTQHELVKLMNRYPASTVVASISKNTKSAAQQKDINTFMVDAKKQLSAGKSIILVAISSNEPI